MNGFEVPEQGTVSPAFWGEAQIRFARSRMGRMILSLAMATAGVTASSIALETTPAAAATAAVHYVTDTGGEGLWLHPDSPSVSSDVSDLMPDGAEFDIDCWSRGDDVGGDAVWDHGTNMATGNTGYATDYYIDTSVTQGNEGAQLSAQGVPECGQQAGPATDSSSQPQQPWDIPTTSEHDRVDHVEWVNTPSGESLHITMTDWGYLSSFAFPSTAFNEVMTDAHIQYSNGMYDQFECHADLAPPWKATWNLDTWRPDVGLAETINDLCNPGGSNTVFP